MKHTAQGFGTNPARVKHPLKRNVSVYKIFGDRLFVVFIRLVRAHKKERYRRIRAKKRNRYNLPKFHNH